MRCIKLCTDMRYIKMMYMHAPRQGVNKQANKDSILFIDLEIRFIEVKDIISSYTFIIK